MDQIVVQNNLKDGIAHLIGLCHDLPEIVLRNCFPAEYNAVISETSSGDKSFPDMRGTVLGVHQSELVTAVFEGLKLPNTITVPIQTFFNESRGHLVELPPLVRALTLANYYAHGLLLAPAADAPVRALMTAECGYIFW